MHNTGYKSALARRVCRYSDARPPRKADGVLLESELPPRMRGKGLNPPRYSGICRITPAYAGKRSPSCRKLKTSRDHPRICGEKLLQVVRLYAAVGSPPHMRGKVLPNAVQLKKSGITPAYAGKSTAAFSSSRTTLGSPPHMQGKEVCENGEVEIQRITPAYAGKSGISSQAKPSRRDHPRICGEKT